MFLVAITKDEILQNFKNNSCEEYKIHPFIITIITDNFLSQYIPGENGFFVVESPLLSSSDIMNVVFSQFTYDKKSDSFFILRSTIGGRPLYYHTNVKGEFFCSTHISLLRKAGVIIEEDTSVLPEFFVYRFVMPPKTLYKDIRHLFAGGQIHLKIINDKCVIRSLYHYIPPGIKNMDSIETASKELYEHLTNSIQRLEPRKKEITILFSGGLDSSILAAINKKIFSVNKSYSTGYPFENPFLNREKRYALSAAKSLEMNNQYHEPKLEDYLTSFIESISIAETPLHHLQTVLLHSLFKDKIHKEKIILCGQGGATIFGYNHYFYLQEEHNRIVYHLLTNKPSLFSLKQTSKLIGRGEEIVDLLDRSKVPTTLSDPRNPIWAWMSYGCKNWVCNHFNITEADIIKERYNLIKTFPNMSMHHVWSLYSLLGDEDITSLIWSKIGEESKKIIYFPLYDSSVLNHVFSLSWDLKLKKPGNCLRKQTARISLLPEFIINRPKSGLGIHQKRWAIKRGPFQRLIPLASKIINKEEILKMQSTDSKRAMTFWNILNYSIWKRRCIYNESLDVLLEELN